MKLLATPRLRLLPILLLTVTVALLLRVGTVGQSLQNGPLVSIATAQAQNAEAMAKSAANTEAAPAQQATAPAIPAATPPEATPESAPAIPAAETASISSQPRTIEQMTESEIKILQQLSSRRTELDTRAQELDQRDALLNATERRVEQKISELQKLRQDVEALLGRANQQQDAQLASMVKIYENMKPTEAARIFEALDMPVLIGVVQKMKEAKAAPILAAMTADKAKLITEELLKRKEVPNMAAPSP